MTPKSLIQKIKHMYIPSGYSMFTQCSFESTKNKKDLKRFKRTRNKNN